MALKRLPYKSLRQLIGINLSTKEYPGVQKFIDKLSAAARKRGYLTKPELVLVCRWKSARAIRQIERNGAETIKKVTKAAFGTRSEQKKLQLLTSLYGVSVPMASSILMLTNPERYGVIDIRVWQLLFNIGSVNKNPKGVHFDFKQWYRYLMIIRYFARMYKVGARDIERTLFRVHEKNQKGTLYNN
jgi:hypothetical protein